MEISEINDTVSNVNSATRLPTRKRSSNSGNSKSRASRSKFQQQVRCQKRDQSNNTRGTSAEEAVIALQKLTGCCCSYFGGCIGKNFLIQDENNIELVDVKSCIDYFVSCRRFTDFKSRKEKRMIVTKAFKDCIASRIKVNNQTRLKMNYILGSMKIQVCKKAFACAYNTTVHALESTSKAAKIEDDDKDGHIISDYNTVNTRQWKDGHIHDFSFQDTQQLFQDNVYSINCSSDGATSFVSK